MHVHAQSTTPVDPRVLDAMLPFYTQQFGNPHSRTHAYGWETEQAVEQAREVGALRGACWHARLPTLCTAFPACGRPCWCSREGDCVHIGASAACMRAGAQLMMHQPVGRTVLQGATECNNMAIKGVANFYKGKKNHIVTTQTVRGPHGGGYTCGTARGLT